MATAKNHGFFTEDRSKRPRLAIPRSRVEGLQDVLSVTGILLMIAALIFQPPGTAPAVLVLLASAIFLFLLITFIRRYPHHFNYLVAITPENAEYQYRQARGFLGWLKTEVVWMLLGMQAAIELLAINTEPAALAALLLVSILGIVGINGTLLYYIFKMSSDKART